METENDYISNKNTDSQSPTDGNKYNQDAFQNYASSEKSTTSIPESRRIKKSASTTSLYRRQNVTKGQSEVKRFIIHRRQSLPPVRVRTMRNSDLRTSANSYIQDGSQHDIFTNQTVRDQRIATFPDHMASPVIEMAYRTLHTHTEPLLKGRPSRSGWKLAFYDGVPDKRIYSEKDRETRRHSREEIKDYLLVEEAKRRQELRQMEQDLEENTTNSERSKQMVFHRQMKNYEFSEMDKPSLKLSDQSSETPASSSSFEMKPDVRQYRKITTDPFSSFLTDKLEKLSKLPELPKTAEMPKRAVKFQLNRKRSKSLDARMFVK